MHHPKWVVHFFVYSQKIPTFVKTKPMSIGEYIHWLWQAIKGLRGKIVLRGVLGVCHIFISLFFIWQSKQMVDIATGNSEGSFWLGAALLVVSILSQILLSTIGARIEVNAEVSLRNKLRYKLFHHIMTSRWAGREGMNTGELMNRLDEDVFMVSDTMCRILPSVLVTGVQFVAAMIFLLTLDWRLAIAVVVIMPFALLFSRIYMKRIRRYTKDIREMDSRLTSYMQEYMQNRTLVSTMEYTLTASDDLASMQSNLRNLVLRRIDFSLFSRKVVQMGFAFGYLVAFMWGVVGLKSGAITFGMMTAFLQLVAQVQRPVVDMSRQLPSFIHMSTSLDRLSDIVNMPREQLGEGIHLDGSVGIRFRDVHFSYDANDEVIRGLDKDIKPSTMTAIVGPTGVGKSTMMRLILALIEPTKGSVEFYNDERSVAASALTRCNIAYVPQGNSLLSGTIRSNLLLANPNATEEQMRQALYVAVADFVFDLPDGLDTQCGEMGDGFSEGQAQRIAIARGLLRSGNLLLLDEPSAALDNATESLLMQRMAERVKDKTVIVVTHSLALSAMCEDVISLEA